MAWMIWGSIPGKGISFFSTPKWPDWLWDPITLFFNGCQRSYFRGKATVVWSWPLTFI